MQYPSPPPLHLDFTLPFHPFDLSSHSGSTSLEYFLNTTASHSASNPGTSPTTPGSCHFTVSPFRNEKGFDQGWWLEAPFLSPPPTPTSTDDPGQDLFWSTFTDSLLSTWPTTPSNPDYSLTSSPSKITTMASTTTAPTPTSISNNPSNPSLGQKYTPSTLPTVSLLPPAHKEMRDIQGKRKKKRTGKKKAKLILKRVQELEAVGEEDEDEDEVEEDEDETKEETLELPESWVYWDVEMQRRFLQSWSPNKLITYILKVSQPSVTEPQRKWVCVKHKLAAVDALGHRLPSYEDLIAEALQQWHQEHQDPWGCQPRFIFKWMAEYV
ncbi:hypothetical protein HMI54_003562 [Coelomomyces lativittatus]|nr:hypothetical protein HMI54_003562 [Coelomomyces lativittatus]